MQATLRCPFCLTLNRIDVARADDRPQCGKCSRPMLLDRPVKIDGDDFERFVAESEAPVLVDFYADWCGPCKVMAPVLDEIARDRTGELIVAKLDTDASPAISGGLGIRGIPTLILFKNGDEAGRLTGAVPKQQIDELIEAA